MRSCELSADCCPADVDPCPSMGFPGDYACVENLCVRPQCADDAQCDAAFPGTTCHPVDGVALCVHACAMSADCTEPGHDCTGVSDDQTSFCEARCDTGAIDCGAQTCDQQTGKCVCEADNECINGFACV